jgi:hypothetical protein
MKIKICQYFKYKEWKPNEQYFSYIMAITSCMWWSDNDVGQIAVLNYEKYVTQTPKYWNNIINLNILTIYFIYLPQSWTICPYQYMTVAKLENSLGLAKKWNTLNISSKLERQTQSMKIKICQYFKYKEFLHICHRMLLCIYNKAHWWCNC